MKDKGEKESYIHLNAELERIARRDKKALLSDQCKAIEENNRMGKTRDLSKKMSQQMIMQLILREKKILIMYNEVVYKNRYLIL